MNTKNKPTKNWHARGVWFSASDLSIISMLQGRLSLPSSSAVIRRALHLLYQQTAEGKS